jgi:hypothetical protein
MEAGTMVPAAQYVRFFSTEEIGRCSRFLTCSGREVDGTGSARRKFVPPPTAIGPVRYHARSCASRARAKCGGHVDLLGLLRRNNPGRPTRNQGDGAVALALPVRSEWHQPVRGLAVSRYDWLR